MEVETGKKLEVLKQANTINQDELAFIRQIDKTLMQKVKADVDDEMLLIHLGMVFDRIRQNNLIDRLPDEITDQLTSKPEYPEAVALWTELSKDAPVVVPESEAQYIIMHITNILRRD